MIGPDRIDADAVVRLETAYRAETPAYPVESGVELVDHIKALPLEISLELIISESSVREQSFAPGRDRPRRVVERLRAAQVSGELLILEAARFGGIVLNLAVQEVLEPYDGPARGIRIPVRLRQIEVAQSRTITLPDPVEPRGAGVRDRGKQQAEEVQSESLLFSIKRLVTGD